MHGKLSELVAGRRSQKGEKQIMVQICPAVFLFLQSRGDCLRTNKNFLVPGSREQHKALFQKKVSTLRKGLDQ